MVKRQLFFALLMFLGTTLSAKERPVQTVMSPMQVSQKYIQLMNYMGKGGQVQMAEVALLLAPDCKKVFNASLIQTTREGIMNDLVSVFANYGGWKHTLLESINASPSNVAVLRTVVETERIGTHTTIIILRFNQNNLITEINELFAPVKEGYNFQKK